MPGQRLQNRLKARTVYLDVENTLLSLCWITARNSAGGPAMRRAGSGKIGRLVTAVGGEFTVVYLGQLLGWRGRADLAAGRASLGHTTLAAAMMVLIFNLRFDRWVAQAHGVSVAGMHTLRPLWLIPVLTVAFLLWTGLVVALTSSKRSV